MKTKDQFSALIQSAPFFENVGTASSDNGTVALSSLAPWGDQANALEKDSRIADEMDWLPTVRDQADPFYPNGVESEASSEDALTAAKSYRIKVYKAVLARLRSADLSQLKAGVNNFEEAAKGAISYALGNAATEVALGLDGKWQEVAEVYFNGNWPCGVTKAGKLVVF
jgi:hypothetical protein